ncbi:hypothetical protein [Rhodococcus sp. WAY2]|uniref:hypothetical protein n=1 Tax=Rhodococcus sp. WAY2 TaxID=2663121 RepID=UPI00135B3AFF|nr:hypothetical protein [Rhodococcus sp. WAY2]
MLGNERGDISTEFQPVFDALLGAEKPRSVLVWIGKSAAAQLLSELAKSEQPVTHGLLDRMPPTRAVHRVRDMLVQTHVLPERMEYLDRVLPWLEHTLAGRPDGHARLIRPYAQWHLLHRARRRAQRREVDITGTAAFQLRHALRAVLELLDALDEQELTLESMRQHHLDRWLAAGSSSRYLARGFIAWAVHRGMAADVMIPAPRVGQPSMFAETDDYLDQLRRCLTDSAIPLDLRAGGALVLLFGMRIRDVLRLHTDQLCHRGRDHYLRLGDHELLVPSTLGQLLEQLPQPASPRSVLSVPVETVLMFPGHNPRTSIWPGLFGARLKQHGITPRASRNTALITLAGELPAAVLADLLGLHSATGVRWAKRARRDWTAYLAERREDASASSSTADRQLP